MSLSLSGGDDEGAGRWPLVAGSVCDDYDLVDVV